MHVEEKLFPYAADISARWLLRTAGGMKRQAARRLQICSVALCKIGFMSSFSLCTSSLSPWIEHWVGRKAPGTRYLRYTAKIYDKITQLATACFCISYTPWAYPYVSLSSYNCPDGSDPSSRVGHPILHQSPFCIRPFESIEDDDRFDDFTGVPIPTP